MRRAGAPQGSAAAIALVLLLAVGGCSEDAGGQVATITGGDDDGMHGAVLTDRYVVPTTPLTDTAGAPYSLADSTDRPLTLVFFGYTNCPDICTLVMANLASVMTRLSEPDREQVDVVFVTTDPARDDPETLREYLDRFDPSFVGLTGELATIKEIGDAMGVYIEKGKKLPTGGYEVDHGTPVVAIDADDRSPIVWTQGTSAADIAEDVTTMLDKATG
jgi:protein SCO1/2